MEVDHAGPSAPPSSNEAGVVLRACTHCARSNAGCVGSLELGTGIHKSTPSSSRLSKNRVDKLEEELDGIVSLLTSHEIGARETPIRSITATPIDGNANSGLSLSMVQTIDSNIPAPDQARHWDNRLLVGGSLEIRFGLPPESAKDMRADIYRLPPIDLGSKDANQLLRIFRDEMNPSFPFISIPDSVKASELRRDQPSLFTSVMAVTSRNSSRQISLGKLFMKQIADRILVNGDRNIDLLLGILTFSTWRCYHFFNAPGLTMLLSSASTLVGDLGLHRPSGKQQTGRAIEQRRTLLGYYYILSIVSTFFRRLESPRWAPYHDDCCDILSNAGIHRDDKYAVALLRIQLFGETISHNPWHGVSDTVATTVPPLLYVKNLQE
ncbi:uncharacterized protein BP5553_08948 [Venustampulla echinocandica]|uniref:Transcription factor domain-containing protein n=1 Tax=Venustampulla echinocandica TaxID=2656787 RepID=A0A370TDG1_9HELO|nr:uncharacterized protein BP5553_08948 [Venustampulla echinocandica]RDL32492.1 hypothetical protein BP5553_08948 [Venustampulla echinocandica]